MFGVKDDDGIDVTDVLCYHDKGYYSFCIDDVMEPKSLLMVNQQFYLDSSHMGLQRYVLVTHILV